jgi:hypothetical protein
VNGSLVQKRNKPSIKFADDSSDERYLTSPADIGSSFSFFASWQPLADDVTTGSGAAQKRNSTLLYGSGSLYIAGINSDFTNGYKSGAGADSYSAGIDFQKSLNLHTIIEGSADINYFGNGTNEIDGSGDASTVTATKYYIGSKVVVSTHNTRGYISELIHYNTDQTDNRTALEANIGETYGITEIPAADDTVNGFVQTWYDQSGEGNDAVQNAASSQPIIVNEGQLVTNTSGNAAIAMYRRFIDGAQNNRYLSMSSGVTADGSTSFAAVEYRRGFAFHLAGTAQGGNTRMGHYGGFRLQKGGASEDEASPDALTLNEQHLVTTLFAESGGTSKGRVDGDERISSNLPDATSTGLLLKFLFRGDNDNSNPLLYSELALYDSDQSSNIPAIEANIANQYGITLS